MDVRTSKPVEQVVAAIAALDLEPIKFKLMDAEEGQGWSKEQVDRVETSYRRFLTLLVKYPETTIAPSKDIDKFWHGHILDTLKYVDDCEQIFGRFLHHFPYFGMRGEEDAAQQTKADQDMHRLYEQEFGEPMSAKAAFCAAATGKAAFCAAAMGKAAFCAAATDKAAFCAAATKAKSAAATSPKPAFCAAATKAKSAAATSPKPAFCAAATSPKPAFCAAATKGK